MSDDKKLEEMASGRLSETDNASSPKVGGFSVNKWAKEGNVENLQRALAEGGDPNQQDENGTTALMWAAKLGYTDIVKILLKKRADPNVEDHDGDSPLAHAIRDSRADMVEVLLNAGPEREHRELFLVKNIDIAKILLDNGADPNTPGRNGDSPLTHAVERGLTDIVEALLTAGANPSLHLGRAVEKGHLEIVKLLLDRGESVTDCFQKALTHGKIDIIKMLIISKRASQDECLAFAAINNYLDVVKELLAMNRNATNACKIALQEDCPNAVELMLENNADPWGCFTAILDKNRADMVSMLQGYKLNQNNVLKHAVNVGHVNVVKAVLDNYQYSKPIKTNFMLQAIKEKRLDVISVLIDSGANPSEGLDNAVDCVKIVELLILKGADPNKMIDWAVRSNRTDMVKDLLSKGADPRIGLNAVTYRVNADIKWMLRMRVFWRVFGR